MYAYFRNGEVEKKGFKNTILQHHYHGREVRALEYFGKRKIDDAMEKRFVYLPELGMLEYKPPLDAQSALLFATGGEDTLLKLHQCKKANHLEAVAFSNANDFLLLDSSQIFLTLKTSLSP